MGSFSIWHWLVVLAVILLLFGGGNKISSVMGDFAKGVKAFKKNMAENDDESMSEGTGGSTNRLSASSGVPKSTEHTTTGQS